MKRNNKKTSWPTEQMDDWIPHFYISYRGGAQKCLTVDIPYLPLSMEMFFLVVYGQATMSLALRYIIQDSFWTR